jgi:hypothetical protein
MDLHGCSPRKADAIDSGKGASKSSAILRLPAKAPGCRGFFNTLRNEALITSETFKPNRTGFENR